jgi:hypothetical protein
MVTNRSTVAVPLALLAVLACAGEASAYLHPQAGRFLQRDPLGYVDGMGVYEYLKGSPVALADPFGTQSGSTQPATAPTCCCVEDPDDCYIEFSEQPVTPNPVLRIGTQNKTGRYQQFKFAYQAELKSRQGRVLVGCNLHQAATSTFTYLHAEDAKAMKPGDFGPPANPTDFSSAVDGNTVTARTPNDCVRSGLVIRDAPGFFRSDPNGTRTMVTRYNFVGEIYVEEANDVKGSINHHATFVFDPIDASYTVSSSDGRINRSGRAQ